MLREQRPNSFGVAGGDPHTKTCRVQMADNASPKKPRAAKYCHCLHGHGATPYRGRALLGTRLPDSRVWRHAAPNGLLRGGRNRIEFAPRSWTRPARMWRCTAMPTWFGRSPGHAAYNSRLVLPLARARTRSPKLGVRAPAPADLAAVARGGRPRPRWATEAFASAAEANLDLLAGGVVLTRVSTRSAVSRSVN